MVSRKNIGKCRRKRMTQVQFRIGIENGNRYVKTARSAVVSICTHTKKLKLRNRRRSGGRTLFVPLHIIKQLHQHRCDRNREDDAKYSCELETDDNGKNDDDGRNADDFSHHERIDKMVFELLDENIESDHQKAHRDASVDKSDDSSRNGSKNGTENGDNLKRCREKRQNKGVSNTKNGKPEINKNTDKNPEQKLS